MRIENRLAPLHRPVRLQQVPVHHQLYLIKQEVEPEIDPKSLIPLLNIPELLQIGRFHSPDHLGVFSHLWAVDGQQGVARHLPEQNLDRDQKSQNPDFVVLELRVAAVKGHIQVGFCLFVVPFEQIHPPEVEEQCDGLALAAVLEHDILLRLDVKHDVSALLELVHLEIHPKELVEASEEALEAVALSVLYEDVSHLVDQHVEALLDVLDLLVEVDFEVLFALSGDFVVDFCELVRRWGLLYEVLF